MRHLNERTLLVAAAVEKLGAASIASISKRTKLESVQVVHHCKMGVKFGLLRKEGVRLFSKYIAVKNWRVLAKEQNDKATMFDTPIRRPKLEVSAPEEPCQAFNCSKKDHCAAGKLACTAYLHFTETGHVHPPTTQFKYKLNGDYFGYTEGEAVKPTRSIYLQCGIAA